MSVAVVAVIEIETLLTAAGGTAKVIGSGVGGVVSTPTEITCKWSIFPPLEPIAVARTVFMPALSAWVVLTVDQFAALPVPGKAKLETTTAPFTLMRRGRLPEPPKP